MRDVNEHLIYFKVENFKRFESFEMNDIGQFNLIVGDNNTGKTSVLESLLFNRDQWVMIDNLFKALQFKNLKYKYTYQDIELFFNKEFSLKNRTPIMRFAWKSKDKDPLNSTGFIELQAQKNEQQIIFSGVDRQPNLSGFPFYKEVVYNSSFLLPFIPFYKGYDKDLAQFYSRLQEDRLLKKTIIRSLSSITPAIDEIELSSPYPGDTPHLIIYQKHFNTSLPLALFGDGMIKLFRLLAEIILNRGKRLMIDEVDAGIHYSRFREFWRTVVKTAYENDVQLFMTTHNEECIKYFVEAFNEPEFEALKKDVRSISLMELPDNKSIKSYTYTYDQLQSNIELGNEVRGGRR